MKTIVISWVVALCGLCSAKTPYDAHPASRRLLERKPLEMTAEGQVALSFERAASILVCSNLLSAVQKSYAAGLPEGEDPEFAVHQVSPGVYTYTNRDGERTTLEELWIRCVPGEKISIALYSEGSRFFGDYQSLCDVEVMPLTDEAVAYSVTVYARPESFAARFIARITPVERYFRHKMHELTDLVVEVCRRMPIEDQQGGEYVDITL